MSDFIKMMEENDKRYEKLRDDYASEGYTGEDCSSCGRNRVLKCNNGSRVCEKCTWDHDKQEYSSEYNEAYPC